MSRPFLIIAQSARMLVQSIGRGGWQPIALDLFADLDTQSACLAWYRVPSQDGRFDPKALVEVIQTVLAEHRPQAWLYGSGFDTFSNLIGWLAQRCPLFGNRAEVARICTRPQEFFPLLDRLAIPYPEISWTAPADPNPASVNGRGQSGWLVKRGGEGGRGVSVYRGECSDGYYQRRLSGRVYTLVFLAGAGRVWWYGFNTLYQEDYNARFPFLFAGAINRAYLPAGVAEEVVDYARRLSRALDLRGLNGLDFMLDGEVPKVLELNPRPGAALGLWDTAWPWGLMAAQVQVCRGEKVWGFVPVPVKGFRIVFARHEIWIPPGWRWPAWCADLTPPETIVVAGGKVCSVTVFGSSVARVEVQLEVRAAWIRRQLLNQPDEEEK